MFLIILSGNNKWDLTGENGWSMNLSGIRMAFNLLIDQRIISFASICQKEEKYRDQVCNIWCFSCHFFPINIINLLYNCIILGWAKFVRSKEFSSQKVTKFEEF